MFLVHALPPIQCFVRKEFLYDFEKGHGEYEPCVWLTLKSIRGQAFRIECYLPNYAAMYDKIPLHGYVWRTDVDVPNLLPLDHLQIWDCPGYHMTIYKKDVLKGLTAKFLAKNKKMYQGEYMFTVDHCEPESTALDTTWNETPDQHKSFNFIKMDNGQFAAQPNNRMLVLDASLNPPALKFPDFKVCTKNYSVEQNPKWALGDTTDVMYIEPEKR